LCKGVDPNFWPKGALTAPSDPTIEHAPAGDEQSLTPAEAKALLDVSFDRVLVFDRDGRYLKVAAGRDRLYRSFEETIGRTLTDVLPEEEAASFLEVIRRAIDSGETQRWQYQLDIRGESLWLDAMVVPTAERTVLWIARDVSQQRRAEDALRGSEQAHRELLAALPVIVYWVSPQPPYAPTYVSPGVEALGYTLAEWMATPDMWLRVIHPDDRERIVAETEVALASHAFVEYEYRVIAKDGTMRWLHDRGEFVRDASGTPLAWRGVKIDVTERHALQERLEALSEEDDLTRLLNRRGFRRVAEQTLKIERRGGRRMALLYFDVDSFKSINDDFGHAEGDRALTIVANALRAGVRDCDVVARMGGDEFVVLAPAVGVPGEGERLGRRLCDATRAAADSALPCALQLSVGVAEADGHYQLEDLLRASDAALYAQRSARRGRSVV
jgi:diguanylate cyclase (GGDEF)-like protein/PAS domain S-box-containing protein